MLDRAGRIRALPGGRRGSRAPNRRLASSTCSAGSSSGPPGPFGGRDPLAWHGRRRFRISTRRTASGFPGPSRGRFPFRFAGPSGVCGSATTRAGPSGTAAAAAGGSGTRRAASPGRPGSRESRSSLSSRLPVALRNSALFPPHEAQAERWHLIRVRSSPSGRSNAKSKSRSSENSQRIGRLRRGGKIAQHGRPAGVGGPDRETRISAMRA